ncbi:ATP-binding protein [Sporosarcina sp. YIM B06819]|uniref:ATP-binding protein n=1 Tax=Sporosarcina sp. YIM B06819 TaxID=3081769 RepID=UPI00298C68BB|nr:ATP-binding protein [Sporosarcina sp. YIM B06819]
MKSKSEIMEIIHQLDDHIADDFEAQDLDFKQWNFSSKEENIHKMIKYAVCMANGGGGSVVFGVVDKVQGMENVLMGIPFDIDIRELEKRIYDNTEPHIMPSFDEIFYNDHSIRLLVMNVLQETPPYATADGTATIRKGKECLPYSTRKS